MKNPACSHSRTVTITSQYQGGSVVDSHAVWSAPNHPSTVLASPNRTPLKIDSFQISAATTYEHAVGRKKTERKNAWAKRSRLTMSARPSESTYVAGTMNAVNSRNVPRLLTKASSPSIAV